MCLPISAWNSHFKMSILLLFFACTLSSAYAYYPSVKVKEGSLLGTSYNLSNGRGVYAFLGIPYASPPIGNDRFKEPKRLKSWKGIRDATSMGNQCVQKLYSFKDNTVEVIGEEDCLFLNVFTPKLADEMNQEDDLMNVLVYIHGGGFIAGSGNDVYPDHISQIDDNIVFVSMNYRLGELGFFSANHSSAPGNNGLKDQAEALRWVRRNIHHFGGNPAKVTIYGCSAGGASVHYQMISPTTNGLFQSAISSSGAVPLPWSLQTHDVLHMSRELASSLNCVYEEVNTMMACLRNKSVNEIMDQVNVKLTKGGYPTNFPISPVIEVPHRGAFLSEHPLTLMRKGRIKHIPWMITMAESEGATFDITDMFFNKTKLNEVNSYWNEIMPVIFKYKNIKSEYQKDYISAAIRKYYLKNELLSNQTARRFFQALGDRIFYNGIIETTKLYSAASLGDTYCYKLYYRETPSHPESNRKNYGCLHCDDESYIIKYDTEKFKSKVKKDPDMRRLLTSSIVAFMKNGNPNNPEVELKWEPISKNGVMNCLGIYSYTVQRMEDIENQNTTRFWKSLPLMPIY